MSSNLNKNQWKSATDLELVTIASSNKNSPNQATSSSKTTNPLTSPSPKPSKSATPKIFKNIKENIKSIFTNNEPSNNSSTTGSNLRNPNEKRLSTDSTSSTLHSQTTNRTGSTSSQELIDMEEGQALGVTTGSRLMEIMKQTTDPTKWDKPIAPTKLPPTPQSAPPPLSNPPVIDNNMDPVRRNNYFVPLIDSSASNHPTNLNNINSNNNNTSLVTNFNPKSAALKLKIIPSSMTPNYYIDKETLADLQGKLQLLSPNGN